MLRLRLIRRKRRPYAPPLRQRLEGFELAYACAVSAFYGVKPNVARKLAVRLFDDPERRNSATVKGRVNTLHWVERRATPEDVEWFNQVSCTVLFSFCATNEAMFSLTRELAMAISDSKGWPGTLIMGLAGPRFYQLDRAGRGATTDAARLEALRRRVFLQARIDCDENELIVTDKRNVAA